MLFKTGLRNESEKFHTKEFNICSNNMYVIRNI